MTKPAKRSQTIVDCDNNHLLRFHQGRKIVVAFEARSVAASVDPEHYRQGFACSGPDRCRNIEIQTIFGTHYAVTRHSTSVPSDLQACHVVAHANVSQWCLNSLRSSPTECVNGGLRVGDISPKRDIFCDLGGHCSRRRMYTPSFRRGFRIAATRAGRYQYQRQ